MDALDDDAFIMLDPAVEILEASVDRFGLLCHTGLDVGMAVPPGEGLLDFVTALMEKPVRIGELREQFDDQQLVDDMLASLRAHGFAHETTNRAPSPLELLQLRSAADALRARSLRRQVVINLDTPALHEQLIAQWNAGPSAPDVLLCCERLVDHQATFGRLAHLRQDGALRAHHVTVQTSDLRCDDAMRTALLRLGAALQYVGLDWRELPDRVAGLPEMSATCLAVHAVMAPDLSILDDGARERVLAWCHAACISGLCLRLDADLLWTGQDAMDNDFLRVFNAVYALECDLGDVVIATLPGDEVVLGNTARSLVDRAGSEMAQRFRLAYLRWRIPHLKRMEDSNAWSQTPAAEEKFVRPEEDLLPNHPELLRLGSDSKLVDLCGGIGRVARRMSHAVGPDGMVISIEMRRFLTERARRFAYEGHMPNLHFRPGLAQRIALPDASVDAAVNEWTGAIWELGLGPAMVREMTRVVRPGGRIAVTHRLVQLRLNALGVPWVQYEQIYQWLREAFVHPELTIVVERVWGQTVPPLGGQHASAWREQFMPRLVNAVDEVFPHEEPNDASVRADVYLTIVAEREPLHP